MTNKLPDEFILPDGSGFMVASYPLPSGHWIYDADCSAAPPMPFRMGTGDSRRQDFKKAVTAAARYAIRASTMRGKDMDFDPDAMVQNFVVSMLGYHTPDGLCHDKDVPDFDPDPIPPIFTGEI